MSLEDLIGALDRKLAAADAALTADYPGDRGVRQPVHTVYVPADRYAAGTVDEWGTQARATVDEYAGSAAAFAEVLELPPGLAGEVYDRMRAKLDREPIEDLRIDFEDGYGNRPDEEEDAAAIAAARAVPATPYFGLRIKSLEAPTRRRGVRTLDLFLEHLGAIPDGFVITLPKVTSVEQVEAMVLVLEELERTRSLPRLKFEIQVETPQAILGSDGTALIARMIKAGGDRVTGLHYGTYDYSASLGVAAAYQSMEHPVADHAKDVMQLAAAGTGVFVSDGSTNVLPVGDAVHDAWRLHFRLVRRSLARGIYQGWDMHPGQLPTRFAATYLFYREGFDQAAARLSAYLGRGESGYLDEPATAAALAAFVLRGVECGAIDTAEVDKLIGLDPVELAKLARRRVVEG
ncbi:aldolase/citrate lyase family protein [Kribbella hippodromi]|uniref:Aldolase/citrate lyase family protein n=1 Tax=Kribbella hippodromi TaxID=434347 RepID=A0ABN2EC38_9ACTN